MWKRTWSPGVTGYDRSRAIINLFTRARYCTPRGRIATAAAWEHLGLTRPGPDRAAGDPMLPVEVDRGPGARG